MSADIICRLNAHSFIVTGKYRRHRNMYISLFNINSSCCCVFAVVLALIPGFMTGRETSMTPEKCDSMIREAINFRENHDDLEQSLRILQDMEKTAEANNWHRQRFLALNNIGVTYMSNHNYGEALDCFNQAYRVALRHLHSGEIKTALNNIAVSYTKEKNLTKAVEIFKKAYDIARHGNDSIHSGLYALNMSQAYISMERHEEAHKWLDDASDYVIDNPHLGKQRLGLLADLALSEHQYGKARQLCLELFSLPDIGQPKYSEILHQGYLIMARSSLGLGDRDAALRYAYLCVGDNGVMEEKIEGFRFLSDLEYSMKRYPQAIASRDSVITLSDSLFSMQNNRLLKISKAAFELQQYQHELNMKESQLRSLRVIVAVSLIALTVLALLAWWGIHNNIQKLKQRRESEENKRIIAEQALREKETEAELEHERLKGQIESQNRELAAKILYFSGRARMVEEMISLFSDKDSLTMAQQSKLEELRAGIDSEKEWTEFAEIFEQTNNGVLLKLKKKHPDLNAADLRFIVYVYMNLTNKEIAAMLSITLDACRKRKERVSKKLGLESANDLHSYLFSL